MSAGEPRVPLSAIRPALLTLARIALRETPPERRADLLRAIERA